MMRLDEMAPNKIEEQLLMAATPTPMPEQVKIGYLRALRKANHGRGATDGGLSGIFREMGFGDQ